jgi:hypothetical protein
MVPVPSMYSCGAERRGESNGAFGETGSRVSARQATERDLTVEERFQDRKGRSRRTPPHYFNVGVTRGTLGSGDYALITVMEAAAPR